MRSDWLDRNVNATETDITVARSFCSDARLIEGWMRGTCVVAGIFAIPSEVATVSDLQRNIPLLHATAKAAKRGWWPRGMSGMFLFPFYLGTHFDPEVIAWVQQHWRYRWAIWHEPVLYDIAQNSVWMRSTTGIMAPLSTRSFSAYIVAPLPASPGEFKSQIQISSMDIQRTLTKSDQKPPRIYRLIPHPHHAMKSKIAGPISVPT